MSYVNNKISIISNETDQVKFNKFINECKEFDRNQDLDFGGDIVKCFPAFILSLFFDLNKEEIQSALDGLGSNDEGLDAFFISEEEQKVFLVQFKSRRSYDEKDKKDAKKEWFSLLETFERRVTNQLFSSKNKRINEIKEVLTYDYNNYEKELYIFHLGYCSYEIEKNFNNIKYHSQKNILDKFVKYYELNLDDDCVPDYVELDILSPNEKEYNNNNDYIHFSKSKHGKKRNTIALPINGEQVIKLLEKGTTILNRNVRGYLGATNQVNKGIIDTALKEPEYFYFYNNGISVTCDKLQVSGKNTLKHKIRIEKPQVINGAQTINSLKVVYDKKLKEFKGQPNREGDALEYMKKIHLLCKIMESNKDVDTAFAKNVTQYSNTQNKIVLTDYFSNRPEQSKIKNDMQKYNINYVIKRGKDHEGQKSDHVISMSDLAEAHLAQTKNPYQAKSKQIFTDGCENDAGSSYVEIFGSRGNHDSVREYNLVKTFFIYKFVSKIFSNTKKDYLYLRSINIPPPGPDREKIKSSKLDFFSITSSWPFFLGGAPGLISKNIFLMDFKTLSYIVRRIVDEHYCVSHLYDNDEENSVEISRVFECLIKNKNEINQIENLIIKLMKPSLEIYAKSIEEMFKNDPDGVRKIHPKTKKSKEMIDNNINEYTSGSEYIKFDFNYKNLL